MELPVLGGISGWTRTISNIGGSADHPVDHTRSASVFQRLCEGVEGRASGHHVVDQRHALAGERTVAAKSAAHIAPARLAVEACLGRRIARTRARFDFQASAEVARDLDGLVVAALAQPLPRERDRDDAI